VLIPCLALVSLAASGCDDATDQTLPDVETTEPGANCPAAACPGAAQQGYVCEGTQNYTEIPLGKYRLLNNLWGIKQAAVTGQQCAWSLLCDTGSAVGWGTSWDWEGGNVRDVLSYTAAILGWHWSSVSPDTGLPVQLSSNRPVTCSWSFGLTRQQGVGYNVNYDLWVSPEATPTESTRPTDEIMIWLSHLGVGARGDGVGTVELAGARWSVYRYVATSTSEWNVYSFVRDDSVNCATLNLMDFFNHLIQTLSFDSSKYLIGIEAGPETLKGKGELRTEHYSCEVQ
jgi:xyloglucan-specific endo-beta-1,4-glucanase